MRSSSRSATVVWPRSTPLLRSFVLSFGLLTTLVLTAILAGYSLLERQRELHTDAEHSRGMVQASLVTKLGSSERQSLLSNYALSSQEAEIDALNFLLVVNQFGQIVYSSRPSWRQLMIIDPVVNQLETDDPEFAAVIRCFRTRDDECVQQESVGLGMQLGSYTIARTVLKPAEDPGMKRERFLVLLNYEYGVLHSGFLWQLLLCSLLSLCIAAVLSLLLWLLLASRLLPRISQLAQTDSLTQLSNRGMFMDLAQVVLAEAEARGGDMVFAILDIDHFKRINDTYGHGCGDAALRHVAEIFRAVIRSEDLLCRLGGEEFAMLLSVPRASGDRALERLRLQLEMSTLKYHSHRLTIQASIGAVASSEGGYNLDYLYTAADQALYIAKRSGRNRICWSEGRAISRLAT